MPRSRAWARGFRTSCGAWCARVRGCRWPNARSAGRRARASSSSARSEEHTSELQSLMRISYAVFCLKKKTEQKTERTIERHKPGQYRPQRSVEDTKTIDHSDKTTI